VSGYPVCFRDPLYVEEPPRPLPLRRQAPPVGWLPALLVAVFLCGWLVGRL
jgi:hypothetical protein